MTTFTIATFNVQNLIGPDQEYYRFERYTPEDYARKKVWLADQLVRINADIVGFQEIFEPEPLREVIAEADMRGNASYRSDPAAGAPALAPYAKAALSFAPNVADSGPGERRPGLALLSRFGFADTPQSIQLLDPPVEIPFHHLGGGDAGCFRLNRLSRPILKARIEIGPQVVTVFNAHLKSRLGEFIRPHGARFSPEIDLLNHDAAGRGLGFLRAGLRRMTEAWVLRRLVLEELGDGRPVIVLGDLNDNLHSPTQEIICGERPAADYTSMRRPDARSGDDRYTEQEAALIRESVARVRLQSAERLFVRKALRDLVYTTSFDGVFDSLDAILLSRHFDPDWPGRIGQMRHFSAFNDHINDGSNPDAPENKIASDHGQVMARIELL